jgi:hypothetical protein
MQKLINSHGPIEDPSPVARASRSLILGQTEGLLSYKATSTLIASSNCCFSNMDIDLHLLELLKVYWCMYVCMYMCESMYLYVECV